MSFHKSHLGVFGESLPSDINGYVPEAGDKPEDFNFGHDAFTADFDENGDGYDGYAAEAWDNFVHEAVSDTLVAADRIKEWQET